MNESQNTTASFNQPSNPTVTKSEQDALIEARPKPIVTHDLTPGGTTQSYVHQQLNTANENRIQEIGNRLQHSSQGMNLNRAENFIHGKAKADFGHSR